MSATTHDGRVGDHKQISKYFSVVSGLSASITDSLMTRESVKSRSMPKLVFLSSIDTLAPMANGVFQNPVEVFLSLRQNV